MAENVHRKQIVYGIIAPAVLETAELKMSKHKHEAELVKKALVVGAVYVKKRGYGEIEAADSHKLKVEYIYRALVEDKLIQPLAKKDISIPNMEHKLALWITRQLPSDHPLVAGH